MPELIAGCKALGLISKFISTPLWTMTEDKSIHVLDMSARYQSLVNCLHEASENPRDFMEGKLLPFGDDTPVNDDCFLDALLELYSHDHLVETYLEVILPALAKLYEKLYVDHLSGGKFSNIDKESSLYNRAKSVPKHNKFSESVFGYIDGLMKTKPNVSINSCEAYIMFSKNRTKDWLDQKSPDEVAKILSSARKQANSVQRQFRERHKQIMEARRLETIRKQQKMKLKDEAQRREKLRKLQEFTDEIITYGLWQCEGEVHTMLKMYESEMEKVNALSPS